MAVVDTSKIEQALANPHHPDLEALRAAGYTGDLHDAVAWRNWCEAQLAERYADMDARIDAELLAELDREEAAGGPIADVGPEDELRREVRALKAQVSAKVEPFEAPIPKFPKGYVMRVQRKGIFRAERQAKREQEARAKHEHSIRHEASNLEKRIERLDRALADESTRHARENKLLLERRSALSTELAELRRMPEG
jgi:hypothetical protein